MKKEVNTQEEALDNQTREAEIEVAAELTEDSKEEETANEKTEGESVEAEVIDNEDDVSDFGDAEEAMKAVAQLQLELREARSQADEMKDKLVRLQADFENFRKRKTKEVADTVRFANQDLLVSLLPILDNFARTLDAIEKTDNLAAVKEGIGMVDNNMRHQLTKIGLEPIECVGKPFDSEIHEAISSIPVEEEEKKGLIIDEVEKGYKYREKVIRFSKVIVGE